jgi:hypothetical protein
MSYVALPSTFSQGYAVQWHHAHGDLGVRVRVQTVETGSGDLVQTAGDPDVPAAVSACFRGAAGGQPTWLHWAVPDAPCDLVLRIDSGLAALFPATGFPSTEPGRLKLRGREVPDSLRGGWGPFDLADRERATRELTGTLRRIARATSLIRVASLAASSSPGGAPKIELVRAVELDGSSRAVHTRPWPLDEQGALRVPEGELFALRVTHRGPADKPIYVTLLAVGPDMEIVPVIPSQAGIGFEEEQRLAPGKSLLSLPYRSTKPFGQHYAIALATREPNDLALLAQPRLPRVRGLAEGSALDALVREHVYFQTRGRRRPRPQKIHDDTWWVNVLRWDAVPAR